MDKRIEIGKKYERKCNPTVTYEIVDIEGDEISLETRGEAKVDVYILSEEDFIQYIKLPEETE